MSRSGSTDGLLKLWNIETGEAVLDITRHREHICAIEFQPGREDYFASASTDCTMCIWRLSVRFPLLLTLVGMLS